MARSLSEQGLLWIVYNPLPPPQQSHMSLGRWAHVYVCVNETWHMCRECVSVLLCILNRHVSTHAFLHVQMCRSFQVQKTCWRRAAHVNRYVRTHAFLHVQVCRSFQVQITCWRRAAHVLLCPHEFTCGYKCTCEC